MLLVSKLPTAFFFFFFNDTPTPEIYPLSLHDALPISLHVGLAAEPAFGADLARDACHLRRERPQLVHHRVDRGGGEDRKSTRLNSSHANISYAVFCLKKKKISHNAAWEPKRYAAESRL